MIKFAYLSFGLVVWFVAILILCFNILLCLSETNRHEINKCQWDKNLKKCNKQEYHFTRNVKPTYNASFNNSVI